MTKGQVKEIIENLQKTSAAMTQCYSRYPEDKIESMVSPLFKIIADSIDEGIYESIGRWVYEGPLLGDEAKIMVGDTEYLIKTNDDMVNYLEKEGFLTNNTTDV